MYVNVRELFLVSGKQTTRTHRSLTWLTACVVTSQTRIGSQ